MMCKAWRGRWSVAARPLLVVGLMLTLAWGPAAAREYSSLWGEEGERWSPESRLPDFSFAGFNYGQSLPGAWEDAPVYDVRDYGAVGDGEADDTQAFQEAIEAAAEAEGPAVVRVPSGRYRITDQLNIRSSHIRLQGRSKDRTTLYFPISLTDVEPNWGSTTGGQRTSNYSWSGGFIRVLGSDEGSAVSAVVEEAARGQRELVLEDASGLSAGDEVRLVLRDDDERTLLDYLYAGDPGPIDNLSGLDTFQIARVEQVDGQRITLNRPLRFDVRGEWRPRIDTYEPTVTHVGIEDLTIAFPEDLEAYEGHFSELGYNGIAISGAASHGWIRNVHIQNAESGIFASGRFWTLERVSMDSVREASSRGDVGHHAITLSDQDSLVTNFRIDQRYIHDLTVTRGSMGNVFARGRAADLNLDHHRRGPYENLFTDLDAGQGTRLWNSGGGAELGRHAGARNTYWNIRAERAIEPPPEHFGPEMLNVVGVTPEAEARREEQGLWIEPIRPGRVHPSNLYEAQRRKRLER